MNFKRTIIYKSSGFTLVELLIAIALISVLSGLIYVNTNPKGRFEEARNQERTTDVFEIMQAIMLNKSENSNALLPKISSLTPNLNYQIGTGSNCREECNNPSIELEENCLDLSELASGGFIPEIPKDPSDESASNEKTKYYLSISGTKAISVGACREENGTANIPPQIIITK